MGAMKAKGACAAFYVFLFLVACSSRSNPEVRRSAIAGSWYPADPARLAAEVDALLSAAPSAREGAAPVMLFLPHAGYAYSGAVAAAGYATLRGARPDAIVIIAPSHYGSFRGCSVVPVDFYETPLGMVKVDKKALLSLKKNPLFVSDAVADGPEHAVEIQLPFLQRAFGNALKNDPGIIPILAGELTLEEAAGAARAVVDVLGDRARPLFIISTDMTHYGERFGYVPFRAADPKVLQQKLRDLDFGAIDRILKKDAPGFRAYTESTGITMCGRNAALIALSLPFTGYAARLVSYNTSGNITGDFANSVSYASIAVRGGLAKAAVPDVSLLSPEERRFLLDCARQNIRSHLLAGADFAVNEEKVPTGCRRERGVFVTLKKRDELRGCIGFIRADKPLYRAVMEAAFNAAFNDPRFPRLEKGELEQVSIEISVLTPPAPVGSPDDVVVGRDGLIVEQGRHRGLLLPQVPVEWGWSREEFLVNTCRKAGLPDYSWKHGAKIYAFQAEIFGERGP